MQEYTILTKNENKRWDFCVLPIFDDVKMDGHPIFLIVVGCPSIMTSSKMGKTKNLIFHSLIKR